MWMDLFKVGKKKDILYIYVYLSIYIYISGVSQGVV